MLEQIQQLEPIILFIIWTIFFALLLRSFWNGYLRNWRAVSGWLQITLCLLVFSIRGAEGEAWFDERFGLPLTLIIKNMLMVLWFWLYMGFLEFMGFPSRWYHFSRGWLFVSLLIVSTPGIVLYIPTPLPERLVVRDVIIALRDSLLLVPAMLIFLRGSWHLLRREQMLVMQMRLAVLVIGYSILFPILAISNILVAIDVFFDVSALATVRSILSILLYFGLLIVVGLLIPYRWVYQLIFVYPRQYWLMYRLERLETYLGHYETSNLPEPTMSLTEVLRYPDRKIYHSIIKILDYHFLLKYNLRPEVMQPEVIELLDADLEYEQLVKQLSRVRV